MSLSRGATTRASGCRRPRWWRNWAAWWRSCPSSRTAPRRESSRKPKASTVRARSRECGRGRQEAWSRAGNVLGVRLDTLGDVLMTTPALRALKEARPGRRVTLLTSDAGAEATDLAPEIDAVIRYDAPWLKATAPRRDSRPEYALADRLRAGRFDAAVIFTV